MNSGAMFIPEKQDKPCVMVGLGTGIAPFRSMIQDRHKSKTEGANVGPMALFFGNRHKETEWLYKDELINYNNNDVLT